MKSFFATISLLLMLSACEIKPEKIEYGFDGCVYCKMIITDRLHAAQVVNSKGRAYKYDAIECMIMDIKDKNPADIGMLLVTDYTKPEALIDAITATYLVSINLPSPMGANLLAVADKNQAKELQSKHTGNLYDWTQIQQHVNME